MKAYLYIILGNIRKRKVFSAVIILLAFFASLFLVSAMGVIIKAQPLYENSYDSSGESELIYGFLSTAYNNGAADYFSGSEMVDEVLESRAYMGILDLSDENIRSLFVMYRPDRNDYAIPEPKSFNRKLSDNEVLVPMDFKDSYDLEIGSIIDFKGMDFCIAGFYEDPICGSPFYHTKRILVSESMFGELGDRSSDIELQEIIFLNIGLKDTYKRNLSENIRELEAGFKEADSSVFSFNQPRLTAARTLVPRIISAVLVLFSVFLLGIMVLVIRYVILAAIEEDHTSLGIMKAIGFKGSNLTILLLFQYLLIVMAGFLSGVIGAYAITPLIGTYLLAASGIVWTGNVDAALTIGVTAIFIIFVGSIVYSQTRKVKKIKPVEAIILGKQQECSAKHKICIYKKPFCNLPVSARMGVKQLGDNLGQYITLFVLTAVFSFAMINISGLSNAFSSADSIAGILGYDVNDIKITVSEENDRESIDLLIREIDEKYGVNYDSVYETGYDGYVGNSAIQLLVYSDFQTSNILSGTFPKASDEIMISSGVSEELKKYIGDTISISLSRGGKAAVYRVVGINNQVYDMGRNITMPESGMIRLEPSFIPNTYLIKINDNSDIPETIREIEENLLQEKKGITLTNERAVMRKRVDAIHATLSGISAGITIISVALIAAVTFLISLVVAWRETVYGGILKAVGFTPNQLRIQFAGRFILITLAGAVAGMVGSVLTDGRLINLLFRIVHIAEIDSGITANLLAVNMVFILSSASASAWWVSRRMKKLDVRALLSD